MNTGGGDRFAVLPPATVLASLRDRSAICRLEDADDEGHSLAMLNRIAEALDRRVEIRFVPLRHDSERPVLA